MRSAGNFNQLQAARQRAFYADAVAQLAAARHSNTAAREGLVRLLGLTSDQLAHLRLPERLPDLPAAVYPAEKVRQLRMKVASMSVWRKPYWIPLQSSKV
jgi:outer membrane protein TolC